MENGNNNIETYKQRMVQSVYNYKKAEIDKISGKDTQNKSNDEFEIE